MLDAIAQPGVLEHVRELDALARRLFGALADRFVQIGDVRVKGCLIALELVADRASKQRAPELQHRLAHACLRRGLLADSSTWSYNIQPSLVTPSALLARAAEIVESALVEVLAGPSDEGEA
jgi:4-aminobutyrate aminotransferase / (S)-3-amino-2-methylpropionate transaminase / 5-aminovalerate transaminase